MMALRNESAGTATALRIPPPVDRRNGETQNASDGRVATEAFDDFGGGRIAHGSKSYANRNNTSTCFYILETDSVLENRNSHGMPAQNKQISAYVQKEIKRTGILQKDVAELLDISKSAVTGILNGSRQLKAQELQTLEAYFNKKRDSKAESGVELRELDVRAGAGGGGVPVDAWEPDGKGGMVAVDAVRDHWTLPSHFVRNILRSSPQATAIIEVLGDSMEPTMRPGDRVFIDTQHRTPSPPGIFAVWDGFGIVVKRIELVPMSEPPEVRLISDNKNHAAYTASLADAKIIGRVIGRITVV